MWTLRQQYRIAQQEWEEHGSFQSIVDAAKRIVERERRPNGGVGFRVHVAIPITGAPDGELFSRLEHLNESTRYVLQGEATMAPRLWTLRKIGDENDPWAEIGHFQSLSNVATRILERDGAPSRPFFFRAIVDAVNVTGDSPDAVILSRLWHKNEAASYFLYPSRVN